MTLSVLGSTFKVAKRGRCEGEGDCASHRRDCGACGQDWQSCGGAAGELVERPAAPTVVLCDLDNVEPPRPECIGTERHSKSWRGRVVFTGVRSHSTRGSPGTDSSPDGLCGVPARARRNAVDAQLFAQEVGFPATRRVDIFMRASGIRGSGRWPEGRTAPAPHGRQH